MTTLGKLIALLVLALIIIGGWLYWTMAHPAAPATTGMATTTPSGPTASQAQTVTANGISFSYQDPYRLATSASQVLVKSYIPPCSQGFTYCLYRTGSQYAQTNFESAGLGITNRADLKSQQACLTTQPAGYTGLHATTSMETGYATSVIGPIGDAGAGHYASGSVYRLWSGTSCTEFETRIGETQFANYPAGTKTEFSAIDRASIMSELKALLASVKLSGSPVVFPQG